MELAQFGLSPLSAVAILAAGIIAGTINAIVGSGTLLTFPTLIAFGYPPVTANMSNTVGLVLGNVSGVYGYRRELMGQRSRIRSLAPPALFGGITGAVLLQYLPQEAFRAIVPVLIGLALVLVVVQPSLSKLLAKHRDGTHQKAGWSARLALFGSGVYGGYFGAAQGVLLMAILGLTYDDDLQRLNGLKNVLATINNFVAALLFIVFGSISWPAAILIAIGSILGGQIGSHVGRRLPPVVLRAVIILVGIIAIVRLVLN